MNLLPALTLLCLVVASVHAAPYDGVVMDEWETFKISYNKHYKDDSEERLRLEVFLDNRQMIAKHNMKFALGEVTFDLRINQFGDMLHQEVANQMNGYNQRDTQGFGGLRFIESDEDIIVPDSVDWRPKGAVTPVKDQKMCGSCWAFSTTGSLEGQHFRKTGKLVSLSEQNLVDCSQSFGNHGCLGGLMDNAFTYIKANDGIDTETSYPYKAEDLKCHFNKSNVGADDTGFVDIPTGNEKALKKAVATVGPISIAIDASSTLFHFYHSGVYIDSDCSSTFLDHGVLAVGYGATKNGTDFWIVKNSWNTSWGHDGYILMARNRNNQCGVATKSSYPLV